MSAGTYYLAMVVDSSNTVDETGAEKGELNNVAVHPVSFDIGDVEYDLYIDPAVNSNTGVTFVDPMGTPMVGDPVFTVDAPFHVQFVLANGGTGVTGNVTATIGIYTAEDATALVGGSDRVVSLGSVSGGSLGYSNTEQMQLSNQFYDSTATYYVGVVIDPDGNLAGETDTTNNTYFVPVTFEQPMPDIEPYFFKANDVGAPGELQAAPGDEIYLHGEIQNNTNIAVDQAFRVQFQLRDSTGALVTGAAWNVDVPSIGTPDMGNNTVFVDLPIFLPVDLDLTQTYQLVMIADNDNSVAEGLEDNNITDVVTLTLREPEIDLVLQPIKLTLPTEGLTWSQGLNVDFQINSYGDSSSPPSKAGIYLSTSATDLTGAILLDEVDVPQIYPGTFYRQNTWVMLPDNMDKALADGGYYIVVQADNLNDVDEMMGGQPVEGNNLQSKAVQIVSPTVNLIPDYPADFIFEPTIYRNIPFMMPVEIRNDSFGIVDTPFAVRVVISSDATYGNADDLLLGEFTVAAMEPNGYWSNDLEFQFPDASVLPDGPYRIFVSVDADNAVVEANPDGTDAESDNLVSFRTELTTLNLVEGVELHLEMIESDGVNTISWGGSYPDQFFAGLMNMGTQLADSFDLTVYLSRDDKIDSNDLVVSTTTLSAQPGEVLDVPVAITMPDNADEALPNGPWFLIAKVDSSDAIAEVDETNNIKYRVINVGEVKQGVDMALSGLTIPMEANFDEQLTIDFNVVNEGDTFADAEVRVYVSADPIPLNALDTIGSVANIPVNVAGGGSFPLTMNLWMPYNDNPAITDAYYNVLFVITNTRVDGQPVTEVEIENNSLYQSIHLTTPVQADLEAGVYVDPTTGGFYMPGMGQAFDWGDIVKLDTIIKNQGNDTVTDSFTVTWYLSATSPWDINFDEDALYSLTSETVTADIASWDQYIIEDQEVALPTVAPSQFGSYLTDGQGELFIVAQVDSAGVIDEMNEGNNYADLPVYIGSLPAELDGWMEIVPEAGMSYPSFEYGWGQTVPVALKLRNFGGGDADNVDVTFFLAEDWDIQNEDGSLKTSKLVQLNTITVTSIPSGAGLWDPIQNMEVGTVIVDTDVELPADRPDNFLGAAMSYNIIAMVDYNQTVNEDDDYYNNISSVYVHVRDIKPDLISFWVESVNLESGVFQPSMMWSSETDPKQIRLHFEVANQGTAPASDVVVSFMLANASGDINTAYEFGQTTLELLSNDPVAGNNSLGDIVLDLPTPESVPFVTAGQETGSYILMMKIDPTDSVAESMETNNVAQMPIRLEKAVAKMVVGDSLGRWDDKIMEFGKLEAGQEGSAFVNIRNDGNGELNISNVISDNAAFIVDASELPLVVGPGQTVEVPVILATEGMQPGYYTGRITVFGDDPRKPQVSLDARIQIAQSPVDLAVSLVDAQLVTEEGNFPAAEAFWGDKLSVGVNLANLTQTSTNDGVFADLFLTESADGSGYRYMLKSNVKLSQMAGETERLWTVEQTLPLTSPFGHGGALYLGAAIRGNALDYEPDTANNALTMPLTITTRPLGEPDILLESVIMPPEVAPGDTVTVELKVRNDGEADATAFGIRAYLSDSQTLSASAVEVGYDAMPGLSVDASALRTFEFTIPEDAAEGVKYLLVQVDTDNVLAESNENNNSAYMRFSVEAGPASDLMVAHIGVPDGLTVGEPFVLEYAVANAGTEEARDVRVEFYWRAVGSTTTGEFLGSAKIASLMPVTEVNEQTATIRSLNSFLAPRMVQPGTSYEIVGKIDPYNTFPETDETNNQLISEALTPSMGAIDLAGAFDNAALPASATWGEELDVPLTITNTGDKEAAPFNVKVVLSRNNVFDTNDVYLTEWSVGSLSSEEGANSKTLDLHVWLPDYLTLADGNFYLLARVDDFNNVNETDETNNLVVSNALAITGLPQLSGYLVSVPDTANYGQTITVSDTVQNYSRSSAGEFEVRYYLSQDWEYQDGVDELLGSRVITSLAGQATNSGTVSLELTQPAGFPDEGPFHIVMVIDEDNQVAEKYEDSAMGPDFASMPIQIVSQGMPDLEVESLEALIFEEVNWGETVNLSYEVANRGTAASGPFDVTFYLSKNALITADKDVALGTVTISDLAGLSNYPNFAEVTLPSTNPFVLAGSNTDPMMGGQYYFGMIIDPTNAVEEIEETNNAAEASAISEIGNVVNVDLVAQEVYGQSGAAIVPNEDFTVYVGIYNDGSEAVGNFGLDIYLTGAGIIDDSAVLLGQSTVSAIDARGYAAKQVTVNADADTLNGFVGGGGMIAVAINPNKTIEEKSYTNNTLYDPVMFSVEQPITADAQATTIDFDSFGTVAWGDSLVVTYELEQEEGFDLPVSIVLQDPTSGGTYSLLDFIVNEAGLTTISNVALISLPQTSPFGYDGEFELALIIDPSNLLDEVDETNNDASATITIGSNAPDLVAQGLYTTSMAGAGDTIQIYADFANYGSENAGRFDIYYYLIDNNNELDTDDAVELGFTTVSSLSTLAYSLDVKSVTIPNSVVDGNYYLAMSVDVWSEVDESDEDNNIVISGVPLLINTVTVTPDSYEPNNSRTAAATLTITDGSSGHLEASLHDGDSDFYSFVTPSDANGFAHIEAEPDGYLNLLIKVYDQNGTLLNTIDYEPTLGGSEVYNSFSFSPARTYYLEVSPVGGTSGDYSFDIELGQGSAAGDDYESNNTIGNAAYIGSSDIGFSGLSIHNSTDVDYYLFTVPENSTGEFMIGIMSDPTLDGVLQIFDQDGELIGSSDNTGAGGMEYVEYAGVPGDYYYAAVRAWAQSTGAYAMSLEFEETQMPDSYESNDTRETASSLTLSNSAFNIYDVNINTTSDVDWYSVTVPSGMNTINLNAYGDEDLDLKLALYSNTGRLVKEVNRNEAGEYEELVSGGRTPGNQLFIKVSGIDSSLGSYSLGGWFENAQTGDDAEPNNYTSEAWPLEIPATSNSTTIRNLTIHSDSDEDYFRFTAPAETDGTVTITTTPASSSTGLNLSLTLLDSDKKVLATADVSGAGQVETLTWTNTTAPIEAGEMYYIAAQGWGTTGTYNLKLETPRTGAAVAQPSAGSPFFLPAKALPSLKVDYLGSGSQASVIVTEQIGLSNDDTLSFVPTSAGSSTSGLVTIRNTGGTSLDYSLEFTTGTVFAVGSGQGSGTIAAGGSKTITVTFTPSTTTSYSDTLTIKEGDTALKALTLSGTGTVTQLKPDIALTNTSGTLITSVQMPNTELEDTSSAQFKIYNQGSASLTITSAQITGTDAADFSLVGFSNNTSVTSTTPRTFTIEFNPTESGGKTANLVLTSNDPDEPTVTLVLTATAGVPGLTFDIDTSVDFDEVMVDGAGGQTGRQAITIGNIASATADLVISSFTFSNSAYKLVDANGTVISGMTLEPGETISGYLVFDPTAEGVYNATLTVSCNDSDADVISLTGVGRTGLSITDELGGTAWFVDEDGDIFQIRYLTAGEVTFTAADQDSQDRLTGDTLTIEIFGDHGRGYLTITDTNSDGDGMITIDNLTIDSGFKSVDVEGHIENLTVAGDLAKLTVDGTLTDAEINGDVSSLTAGTLNGTVQADSIATVRIDNATDGAIDAALGALTVNNDANGLDITSASAMNTVNFLGDATNIRLTVDSLNKLNIGGDLIDSALTATEGAIRSINIKGSFTENSGQSTLSSADDIRALKVRGDMEAQSLSVSGSINSLLVNGSFDVANLSVSGELGKASVGRKNSGGDVAGTISAGSMGKLKFYGDLSGAINAVNSIRNLTLYGDMLEGSAITADTIDKLVIYGVRLDDNIDAVIG